MLRSASRVACGPLARAVYVFTTLATAGVFAACADDNQPVTGPAAPPSGPKLAVGDVITVTNNRGTKDVGSLRWAVAKATGGEIIRFDPRLAGATITLDSTLVISHEVTIEGDVNHGITISGGGRGRVIDITVTGLTQRTTLRNVTITGGKLGDGPAGAGIRSTGPLYVEHSTLHGNVAVGPPAILALGPLVLYNSTVTNNTATGYLYHAVFAAEGATVRNTTIAFNSQGGIRFSEYWGGQMDNSIVANNGGFLNNCLNADAIRHGGMNVSNDLSCGDSTYVTIADPMLAPLADNGGPTMTLAVDPTSPAFNGLPTGCEGVGVDQRYKQRDTYCDIGSFESTDSTHATVTIDRVATATLTGTSAIVTGTVKCNRGGDQFNVAVQVSQRGQDKTVVQGTGTASVTCSVVAQPWSALVVPSAGVFKNGGASATAATRQTPSWVVPDDASRSIKLVVPAA